jgi:predicted RNA-binding protein with RPS1 domain
MTGSSHGPPPSRRHPPASVPPEHPAAKLPRRRLAVLRPGMVVQGVITRLVRGGALVDILLENGEPAFVPLNEIPARAMPRVRDLIESGEMQDVRLVQLDRASGTATASLRGMFPALEQEESRRPRGRPAPPPPPEPPPARPEPLRTEAPRKPSASERARKQQEEILRRLRAGG